MKILVTGGGGYIGSKLIPELLARGYAVDVVDLFWFGDYLPENIGRLQKDIFELTEDDLKGYHTIISLAGLSNDPMAEFAPNKNFIYNAAAPSYLSYIAKRAGIKRFIYASSCSVYGYTHDEMFNEDMPTISDYPYGISKLQGEAAALKMQTDDFSVISLRKGTVSGVSPRMRFDLIINAMYKSAVQDQCITVNNPSIWRPILAMKDAVSAYIRSVEAHEKISGIFNIATGNFTVGEAADIVKANLEKSLNIHIELDIKHLADKRNYKVTMQKAADILSFKPKESIESILDDLIANQEQYRDFSNLNFYNIKRFKEIEL